MKIKLCGVRTVADALLCAEAGADEIGVIFAPKSRRCVTVTEAAAIRAALPATLPLVGVFQDANASDVAAVAAHVSLSAVQLHGRLPGFLALKSIPQPIYRALQVTDAAALALQGRLESFARILLDAPAGGGSGKVFDWALVRLARKRFAPPIFLAGGLTPDNLAQAIAVAHPDGVDVASGIEGKDGFKDAARVRAFMQAARATS